ncbi:NAD+ kinase family protein [Heterostelium album PN500]|uniref:NAD+ kinase family protein n=1 Tax=Heterostelium pallidum (strain ATCC 26659 / Pp 5 / PN500) TaxID=670386 RepID=D3BQF5_HETP5|nr:NAD+ kinase family protein [Heterostelium album PN500]EFA76375.1 NAD+ kinase family protein [Heterostelium album PN500]|eukprot:XP_020428507.1 NAD+ kinase family protein [Heterostelium album PN500]
MTGDIFNTISLILSTLSIIILFRNWQKSTNSNNNNQQSHDHNNQNKLQLDQLNQQLKKQNIPIKQTNDNDNDLTSLSSPESPQPLKQQQQQQQHCNCCSKKEQQQQFNTSFIPSDISLYSGNFNFGGITDSPQNQRVSQLQSDDVSSTKSSPTLSGYSSSDEDCNSPQLAKAFLSPLNFTTGPKYFNNNKKNQSYYVSTYYSSCEIPDYESSSMNDLDEEDETLSSDSRKSLKKKKSCILPQILQLKWKNPAKKVLVIHKNCDGEVLEAAKTLVKYLVSKDVTTFLESENINEIPTAQSLEEVKDPYSIDFIISMGGDGTVLHTSSLFKTYIPPILPFNMGSLGFLTSFDYANYKEHINRVIEGKCFVSYRLRLSCTVISGTTYKTYQVLNEVAIDRGNNPYLSNLECFCDDKLITMVQADGVIIATSTGSTAYSLSAGGSLVHPTIPAMLITPICPHTLSFRPIILPSTSTLAIRVSEGSRNTAWVSFDGKSRQEIKQGDSVIIRTSKWAVPDESNEWFEKLANNLNWNVRMVQKNFSP